MSNLYIASDRTSDLVYNFSVVKADGICTIRNLDTGEVKTYPVEKMTPKKVLEFFLGTSYIGRKFDVKKI